MERMDRRVAVLDTSAFVAGFDPFSLSGEQYTVPLVKDELIAESLSAVRLKTAVESGKLKIENPSETFLDSAKSSAVLVGDALSLSETDLGILALALELQTRGFFPVIVTDDYSIQNVANQMGIEFASLLTFGIRQRLQWVRYCPACYREYSASSRSRMCKVCGTTLKRKPLRKYNLTGKVSNEKELPKSSVARKQA